MNRYFGVERLFLAEWGISFQFGLDDLALRENLNHVRAIEQQLRDELDFGTCAETEVTNDGATLHQGWALVRRNVRDSHQSLPVIPRHVVRSTSSRVGLILESFWHARDDA